MELPLSVQREMDRLCSEGDQALDSGDFEAALSAYRAAEALIPEPKRSWEAAAWIYTAIGDVFFYRGDYSEAVRSYQVARLSAELGNPYLHLKMGQCYFELGNYDNAGDELTRAYMSEGPEIFDDEDPKYFDFLSTRIEMD